MGESARGWTSQGVKEPGGESSRGWNGKGAKKPDAGVTSVSQLEVKGYGYR